MYPHVARARQGDENAWRALYAEHSPAVYGYILAFCRGDAASAADLTQDSFAAAAAALPELRDDGAFGGWLRVIARRRCLRWLEDRRRHEALLHQQAAEPPAPADDTEALSRLAWRVLESCPDPALRAPATLFYGDPPSTVAEIGSQLGLSVTAVTTRLHRFRGWARLAALKQLAELRLERP